MEGNGEGANVDEIFDEVPENLRAVIKQIPLVAPDDEEERQLYSRVADGNCITCGAKLGANTMIVVSSQGILYIACGGACLTDMQVIGWLQEVYKDITDKVDFRGGGGDEPEEDEDGDS